MQGKTINELKNGDVARFSKTISESDVYLFAGITGDMNPVHIDAEYASGTVFGNRVAHGILAIGFISNVLGTQLPGSGAIYLEQSCRFLKPVFIGDTITATVEVLDKDEVKNRVRLRTYCVNQRNELTLDGEAVVMPQRVSASRLSAS